MDVTELERAKFELERDIVDRIKQFEKETGLKPECSLYTLGEEHKVRILIRI